MRQMPNRRMKPRGRPQRWQRKYRRELNFCGLCDLVTSDVFATMFLYFRNGTASVPYQDSRMGNPISNSNARASSSFRADVTTTISIPRTRPPEAMI